MTTPTTNVDLMTDSDIQDRIQNGKQKYQDIEVNIHEKAFLWIAEKEGCAPIYIFGTIHLSTFDNEDLFGDAVDHLIDKVDIVFTEVPVIDEFASLKAFLNKSSENPTEKSDKLSLDKFIAQKAFNRGKKTKPLENVNVREAAGRSQKDSEKFYEQAKKTPKKDLDDFSENYLTHVSPSIIELNDENNPESLRNYFWMPTMLFQSMELQKSSLIVCGSSHNAGKYGLPNLLASEGYALKPLIKTAPTPKSELIRDAARGSNSNSFFKPAQNQEKETQKNQEKETQAMITPNHRKRK